MKRLFSLFLVLFMLLLCAGGATAEQTVIMPFPTETEVNTSWGVYLVSVADASGIVNSGAVKLSLYAQDMYRLEDIEGLHQGSFIQVGSETYLVSRVDVRDDGSVAIDSDRNSFPVVFSPHGEVYVATINDSAVGNYVGDYTLTLPLPDKFSFCWMHSTVSIDWYDGEGFVNLLSGGKLTGLNRSCTVLSFSGGLPATMVLADFTVGNPEEAVHTANASRVSPSDRPAPGPVYSGGAGSFTVKPIMWDSAVLGKCGVPTGYEMQTEVHCGDNTTCLGAPLRMHVQAVSASASSVLGYFSSEVYLERVKSPVYRQKNGQHDGELDIIMWTYMEAPQFCDWVASRLNSGCVFWKEEDSSFLDSRVAAALAEYRDSVVSGMADLGIKTNWYDVTAAHRVYTYEYQGVTYALCVLAEVRAYQMDVLGNVTTCWDSPEYYYLSCPLSDYERIHATDFQVFIANTTYNDTFTKLQEKLSAEIENDIRRGWARDIAASNAYVSAMNALMSQSVNNYLSSSNYSASSRFSDYIFDQNEYTTSDGYSCSISTAYDYVWEGDNGTVYYSNSAFDMPSGANQLSPR